MKPQTMAEMARVFAALMTGLLAVWATLLGLALALHASATARKRQAMERQHHHTKRTVEAKAWCPKCSKPTMHRVDDGRLGPCLDCCARADRARELRDMQHEREQAEKRKQGTLWSEES